MGAHTRGRTPDPRPSGLSLVAQLGGSSTDASPKLSLGPLTVPPHWAPSLGTPYRPRPSLASSDPADSMPCSHPDPLLRGALLWARPALIACAIVAPLGWWSDSFSKADEAAPDFAREIQPLLAKRCYACHGPDKAARQARLRLDVREDATRRRRGRTPIAPGDPSASEILERVRSDDPDAVMPPPDMGDPLTEEEIARLEAWVAAGAEYAEHWAFLPPHPPIVPNAAAPLDGFIQLALADAGLEPASPAEPTTVFRRLHLDLIGLPPSAAELAAFEADTEPGALERATERLLASPHFGERWASVWLDVARYADTKGYEKDGPRDMWPWRDWVVDQLNADLPYDEFLRLQMAGDLVPDADANTRLATAFHRNTLTNDEGGTDNEEFRVAAVQDRVETTVQAALGLTFQCARCHDHKYDPFSTREYYGLFAFLNQTADADLESEAPTLEYVWEPVQEALDQLAVRRAQLETQIATALDAFEYRDPGFSSALVASTAPDRFVWLAEGAPAGARGNMEFSDGAGLDATRGIEVTAPDLAQRFFTDADPLELGQADEFFVYVYLDPAAPTRELLVQLHEPGKGWIHGVYWGEDLIPYGDAGTPQRVHGGALPLAGEWARLAIPLESIDLGPGRYVDGLTLNHFAGTVRWDDLGFSSSGEQRLPVGVSQAAWELDLRRREARLEDAQAQEALYRPASERNEGLQRALEHAYLRSAHAPSREVVAAAEAELAHILDLERKYLGEVSSVPVLQAVQEPRESHVLVAGSFLNPGEVVEAQTPDRLHAWPQDAPRDRRGLAQWLTSPDNPLLARVAVNRVWSRLFGTGLVRTEEDFGVQGELPSHPELLDWLALEFTAQNYSLKNLLRTITGSATYRQSARASLASLERDPDNRLLSRSPRTRLSAEQIRDSALVASGLFQPFMGGPPVYPPQPEGIWEVVYSGSGWRESQGRDRYRRALYTFMRRTAPYPSLTTFDAPSREICTVRRQRTNTPLQALVTLNDPAFFELAQGLARLLLAVPGDDRERITTGFRRTVARAPRDAEIAVLTELLERERERFGADAKAAIKLAAEPLGPLDEGSDAAEAAAWTVLANVLLNTDEFLCRP